MNNLILFDDDNWEGLLPLTFTKPIGELRVGILTIKEKWEKNLKLKASYITQDYLSDKYPIVISEDNLIINSTFLPSHDLLKLINRLSLNEALLEEDELIAARLDSRQFDRLVNDLPIKELKGIKLPTNEDLVINKVLRPYDLFTHNATEIESDLVLLTKNKTSQAISNTNYVATPENIFVEKGAQIEGAFLNASHGPIYIGRNATVMEGAMIRGPFALGEGSTVKMGAKIYAGTTIGPKCKVAGEINNSIILGNSNKAHEGYLGNSVLGEWCNIGAGTNISNLKNNYKEVKIWSYVKQGFELTGLQFCGLIMGDHSKTGIGTMFNTGTVIGAFSNIFGEGFPRNFIPSFAWGGKNGFITHNLEKAIQTAKVVMTRRSQNFTPIDEKIAEHIFLRSASARAWEQ